MSATSATISVPEIHCNHCKESIEGGLAQIPGVHMVAVDVGAKMVAVEYDAGIVGTLQLVAAIEDLGYAVPQ